MAVGSQGTILHSSDGDSWTVASSTADWLRGVTWNGERFVAVGSHIVHSTDGEQWSAATDPATSISLQNVAWGAGRFVAVSGVLVHSSDGDTWTEASDSPATAPLPTLTAVAWGGSLFVTGGATLLSNDGLEWTEGREHSQTHDIIWIGTHFVSVGYAIETSSNGNDWRYQGSTPFTLEGVAYSGKDSFDGGRFVAVGYEYLGDRISVGAIVYGSDAGNLMRVSFSAPLEQLNAVVWNGKRFVAVGDQGTIVHSVDGIAWSAAATGTSNDLRGIAWNGTRFVAVGNDGTAAYSSDGETWTLVDAAEGDLTEIVWAGTRFVAVGEDGAIVYSSDGVSWSAATSGTLNHLWDIAWNGTRLVAVGSNGTILVSP